MPRVTQECDFTIHEDEPSVCSSAGGSAYLEEEEPQESGARESLDGGPEGEEHLRAEEEELAGSGVFHGDANQLDGPEDSTSYSHDDFDPSEEHGDDTASPEAAELDPDGESSTTSDSQRRTSGRTDALIHAAAKAVVARIESRRTSPDPAEAGEEDPEVSMLSHATDGGEDYTEQADQSYADSAEAEGEAGPRASDTASPPAPMADDAGGDSSSHNGADDDVFSDRSPRSSTGSLGSASGSDRGRKYSLDGTLTQASTRSPRISNISQYDHDEEDFVPASRSTPRPPFRSPSSVKAMQMTSPPPSAYGSPRSSGRRMYPTISRLGSPVGSAQYSPKGRSTPPRLKARKEAPLVLLHVTLLPPAWPWAGVLEAAGAGELGEAAEGLRDAWRQLQSRVGDTVLERGVLLPHPQGDFEVLEERTLEALELPLRRRARILECGHYLGPSNEMAAEDSESECEEDDGDGRGRGRDSRARGVRSTHWCATCEHDIKYDSLGPGRVFRVKVYASNGLMMAGAWEACWKEMERVDVEIEPFVDAAVQGELTRLATEQQRREDEAYMQHDMDHGLGGGDDMEDEQGSDCGEQGGMADDHDRASIRHQPSPSLAGSSTAGQGRSLLSPDQHHHPMPTPSPSPEAHVQEPGTTVTNHGPAHVVPATPASDMQIEECSGSHSVASHHHARTLASPPPDTAVDDDRALLGCPEPRLLHSAADTDTRFEQRSHSSLSRRSPVPRTSDPDARMRIEDRDHSSPSSSSADHRSQPHIPSSRPESPLRIEQHPDDDNDDDASFPPAPDDVDGDEDRRRRDEERLREIYGHTPPQAPRSPSPSPGGHRRGDAYVPPAPPSPSPSQLAHERREERRRTYEAASLPELLREAVRVFLRDRRNVVIVLLGALALGLAVRGGGAGYGMEGWRVSELGAGGGYAAPEARVEKAPVAEARVAEALVVAEAREARDAGQPCDTPGVEAEDPRPVEPETIIEREVVRVVETITETVKVTATTTMEAGAGAETQVESPEVKPPADASEVEEEEEAEVETPQAESVQLELEDDATMVEGETSGDDPAEKPLADPVLHEEL